MRSIVIRSVLFLGLIFGVSITQIEPALQYQAQGPVFFLDWKFFQGFLNYPGGLAGYWAAFLQQFYLQPWLGASITTLLIGGVCWVAKRFWGQISRRPFTQVHWLPAPLILLVQTQYQYPWMELVLGLLGVLGCAGLYLSARSLSAGWRTVVFLVLAIPLYWFTGGVFLLYALLCGLTEMLRSQSWLVRMGLGLFFWIAGAVLPFLSSRLVFIVSTADAYWLWLPVLAPIVRAWTAVVLVLSFPLVTVALAWPRRDSAVSDRAKAKPRPGLRPRAAAFLGAMASHPILATLVILGAFLSLFFAVQDRQTKRRIQIDDYARRRQWDQVLRLGPLIKNPEPIILHEIDRALYHTGRLPHDMFSFPQRADWDFWLSFHDTFDPLRSLKASDTLFELGQINRAERMAGEHYELRGYHAAVLQRLALIYVLKDEPQVARLYLNQLTKTITHGSWARHCLSQLESDPALANDKELARIRLFMPRRDYVGDFGTEALLNQLLIQNRRNQMAFEYLMAHYLLTSQLNKVAALLSRLNDFEYQGIPRHYEEAVLLYQTVNENQPVNLYGRRIRPETIADFDRFNQQIKRFGGDLRKALETLQGDFGNTYWFFYLYGCSASMVPYVTIQLNP